MLATKLRMNFEFLIICSFRSPPPVSRSHPALPRSATVARFRKYSRALRVGAAQQRMEQGQALRKDLLARSLGVKTPIIEGPRPLPGERRADALYTLNCEEPNI